MEAVRILQYEHYVIKEFLDQLAEAASRIPQGRGPDRSFFESAISFCRNFADKAHHYKEEHVMFAALAQKHDGKIDGQIERHRTQHEHCRNLVHSMSVALESYERGEEAGATVLLQNLNDYVATLRSHIRSEDEIFFPMVEVFLSEEEGEALLTEFKKYEEKAGADLSFSEAGRMIVQELTAQLG